MNQITAREALSIQARQVAHYSARYPQVVELVRNATNTDGMDLDAMYDVALLNNRIPRGGKIEDLLGVDFS